MTGEGRAEGGDATGADAADLLEYAADVIVLLADDGTIRRANEAVGRSLGLDPTAVVGDDVHEYVHPDDRAAVDGLLQAVAGDGEANVRETVRVRHADGEWRWFEADLARRPAAEGGGVVVSARDVTGRVRGRDQPDLLLERMTDGFLAIDEDWRYTYLNDRAADLLSVDPEAIVGDSVYERFPSFEGSDVERRFREALETGESVTFETRYESLDAWFAVTAYPSETGLSVFFRDVTDRKETELALKRSEQALRDLHDVASDADLPFDEKLSRLLELGCDHLDLGVGFLTRIEDDRQSVVRSHGDHDLLQRGRSCPLSEAYCKRTIDEDGLLATRDPTDEWVDEVAYERFGLETYLGGKVIVDGDLYGTLCFADTERRDRAFRTDERAFIEVLVEWVAYELERDRREGDLQRKNDRLEAFASMVSHDLRNPLTVAQGNLGIARESGDEAAFDEAAEALDRMERLIEDLLWLAREGQDVGDLEAVPIAEVAREAWRFVATDRATLTVDAGDAVVEADPDRLLQLLENLFRNAVEHAGPAVTIRVSPHEGGFAVEDDGPGIPPDERDAVFDAGYSSDDGTGIGLAIVDQIASAHGWRISVEASSLGGARFEFVPEAGANV